LLLEVQLIDFCGTGVSIEDMNEVEETAAVNGIRRLEVHFEL
jgi:hypothetical protein